MKAIVLLRVSTDRQEIETQRKDLIELTRHDGYKLSDLIFIEGIGASAIKLNAEYLREIDQLYKTIESDKEINAVYAWELSRIGRNESKLLEIKNFLIERKIQLVIYQPSLRLLDRDGSVNSGIEMAISIFITMAKQEMLLKAERFARGKARNKAEGKYNGGRIKLGYMLDATKHFEINPDTVEVVRMIFTKYANNEASVASLHKELVDLGVYNRPSAGYNGVKQMNAILKDRAYIGENNYPRIISDELFDAVQAKFATHPKRRKTKYIYYCGSIMKDKQTGYTFVPDARVCIYSVNQVRPRMQLSINYMDYACWFVAMYLKNMNLSREIESNRAQYEAKLTENMVKIGNMECQIEGLEKQIDRAIAMNIERPEHYSSEKLDTLIKTNEGKMAYLTTEIAGLQTDNAKMRELLDHNSKMSAINLTDELSDALKREIIEQVIERIVVERVEQRYYRIQFINKIGYIDNSYWVYDSRGCGARGARMYLVDANGARLEFSDMVRKNKRFVRKK